MSSFDKKLLKFCRTFVCPYFWSCNVIVESQKQNQSLRLALSTETSNNTMEGLLLGAKSCLKDVVRKASLAKTSVCQGQLQEV